MENSTLSDKFQRFLLDYFNKTPELTFWFYDAGLMPEETTHDETKKYYMFGMIYMHYLLAQKEAKKQAIANNEPH